MAATAEVTDALKAFIKREAGRAAAAAGDDDGAEDGAEDTAAPASALGQTLLGGGDADGSDADERAAPCFGVRDGAAAAAALRDAAALGEAAMRARAGGVMADADTVLMAAALRALGARVAAGQGAALGPDTRVRPAPRFKQVCRVRVVLRAHGIDVLSCTEPLCHRLAVPPAIEGWHEFMRWEAPYQA